MITTDDTTIATPDSTPAPSNDNSAADNSAADNSAADNSAPWDADEQPDTTDAPQLDAQADEHTAQPGEPSAAADAEHDEPDEMVGAETYKRILVERWQMVEMIFSEARLGLHNALDGLKKTKSRKEFSEIQHGMKAALLSTIDTTLRAHEGFLDRDPREQAGAGAASGGGRGTGLYVPDTSIVIAKG